MNRRGWWESPGIQAWEPDSDPSINLGSSGPTRVDSSKSDPDVVLRPVGFTARLHGDQGDDVVAAEILCSCSRLEGDHPWDVDLCDQEDDVDPFVRGTDAGSR